MRSCASCGDASGNMAPKERHGKPCQNVTQYIFDAPSQQIERLRVRRTTEIHFARQGRERTHGQATLLFAMPLPER